MLVCASQCIVDSSKTDIYGANDDRMDEMIRPDRRACYAEVDCNIYGSGGMRVEVYVVNIGSSCR